MASPTSPTHGLYGNIYTFRENGYKSVANSTGLNDVTWGAAFAGAASAYYEVVIDASGTPDTFKWRVNGGGWTTGVAITGVAQAIGADGQTITFGATTGHTVNDQWSIGNFKDEATTESGDEAQITTANKRLINPNNPPTFTDDGSETVLQIDYTKGWAKFTGNVGNVDVDGNNGFVVEAGLQQLGYFRGFTLNLTCDLADVSRQTQKWKEYIVGQCSGTGTIEKFFISDLNLFEMILNANVKYFLLQLFNYDPDFDQTGDHFNLWTVINSFGINAPITDAVLETIGFQVHGNLSFTANS